MSLDDIIYGVLGPLDHMNHQPGATSCCFFGRIATDLSPAGAASKDARCSASIGSTMGISDLDGL